MLYIISLLFLIIKGLNFVIRQEVLFHLTKENIICLFLIVCTIIISRKLLRYKKIFLDLVDHLMQYRFKSKEDYYYSLNIIITTFTCYIGIIIYLRLRAFNKPINLDVIYLALQNLYSKMSKGMLCYNLFVFILIIYLFIIFTRLIKKRLNIHITKLHFYWMCYDSYKRLHYYFRDHISVDACFINKISNGYNLFLDMVISVYLFGHYKNSVYRYADLEDLPNEFRNHFWTAKERNIYETLRKKCNSYFFNTQALYRIIKAVFYNLHFLLFIIVTIYDILYNNFILMYVAKILPFLFLYQIYIYLSQFVSDKILYNVSAEINTLYYQDVTYLSDKVMLRNNEMFERPNGQEIIKEFLEYEAVEFYWTKIKR